jgi:hypothetical protein
MFWSIFEITSEERVRGGKEKAHTHITLIFLHHLSTMEIIQAPSFVG